MATLPQAAHKIIARLSRAMVADCPAELAACEICNRPACSEEEWLRCEKRLAAKRSIEAGTSPEAESLKRIRQDEPAVCEKAKPDPSGSGR